MIEKLYPQFVYFLQDYLVYLDYVFLLNTSKKEFGEIRREVISLHLKNDCKEIEEGEELPVPPDVDIIYDFVFNEKFRNKILNGMRNSAKQLSFTCRSQQVRMLLSLQIPFRNIEIKDDFEEFESSEILLSMNGLVSGLSLAYSRRWGYENLSKHLFSSLTTLHLDCANSIVIFPFLPSLTKVSIYQADNLVDVNALSHVKSVNLWHCQRLDDVSPLCGSHIVSLRSLPQLKDIRTLGYVYNLDLEDLELPSDTLLDLSHNAEIRIWSCRHIMVTSNFHSLANVINLCLSIPSNEERINIDITLFHQARSIYLKHFNTIFDQEKIEEKLQKMKNLRELSFVYVTGAQSIVSLLHKVSGLRLIELCTCVDINDVTSLAAVPEVRLMYMSNCFGLGRGNKEVSIFNMPTSNLSPLNHIPRLKIVSSLWFVDVGQVKDVRHLTLSLCDGLSDLTPLKYGRMVSLTLQDCLKIVNLNGAEDVEEIIVIDCENLVDISALPTGRNRKFTTNGESQLQRIDVSIDGYDQFKFSYNQFCFIRRLAT